MQGVLQGAAARRSSTASTRTRCSACAREYAGKAIAPGTSRERIRSRAARHSSSIRPTASYLGDWKAGEKIAQIGRRHAVQRRSRKRPRGGNCYACHQLTQDRSSSYGTIGPPLYNFGKLRGYTPEMQKYAYGKVYNAEAFAACSNMPRFGHKGILTEQQIKDVVALLMDPESPVNK